MRTTIRCLAALTALALVTLTALPVLAQSTRQGAPGAQFIEFDPTRIDGGTPGQGSLILGKEPRPVFEKLLKLKKSFKPAIGQTMHDRALK